MAQRHPLSQPLWRQTPGRPLDDADAGHDAARQRLCLDARPQALGPRRARLAFAEGLLSQDVYAGPEVEAYRAGDYTKLRLGLHLTGLRLFGVVWRLSGGWQRTSDRPSEAYATLGVHWLR
ncbi:MAG: hypothetical protein C0420_09145 [Methylobacterium sp.]|nr:hypothetical protein [Methylobacterium sp.]